MTHNIADVNTVHAINHTILKIKPIALPSKDIPLSASFADENKTLHGASDNPSVHIAISAFFV